jgi:hypothetical protein
MYFLLLLCLIIVLFLMGLSQSGSMVGGGREGIFSRFYYIPRLVLNQKNQYPYLSRFDTVDDHVFSKIYNVPGPLKIIRGRPYRFYRMSDGSWGQSWSFPERAHHQCFRQAEQTCQEPTMTLLKTPKPKLGALAIQPIRDIVKPSQCFDQAYQQCVKQNSHDNDLTKW